MKPINSFMGLDGKINFDLFFGIDKYSEENGRYAIGLLNNIFSDVQEHYKVNNSQSVENYKFKPAELILPDLYNSVFDRDKASLSEIKDKGSNYFKEKLDKLYNVSNNKYDIKLELSNGNQPVYIKYVDKLGASTVILKSDIVKDDELGKLNVKQYYKSDNNGKVLYKISDKCRVTTDEYGNDVIEILAYKNDILLNNSKSENIKVKTDNFEEDLNSLIKSFKGNIKGFIPLMNSNVNLFDLKTNKFKSIHKTTINQFNKFSGYSPTTNDIFDNT
jgi:hypothetical protein